MESGGTFQLEWQCPSCTLLNKAVSFKCRVCGTPKGTSTRQSKYVIHLSLFSYMYMVITFFVSVIDPGFMDH